MRPSASYLSLVTLTALSFTLLSCLATVGADTAPALLPPYSFGQPYPSERYNNSVFHQECIYSTPSHCTCTSLWDSGCNCDGKDAEIPGDPTACDCASLCREVWTPGASLTPLTQHQCHVPQTDIKVFLNSDDKVSMNIVPYFQRLKEVMGDAISIDVHYIVSSRDLNEGLAYGNPAIMGDLMAKCALSLYPDPSISLPYITCLSHNKMTHATLADASNCSKLHTEVKFRAVQDCATTVVGVRQLQHDLMAAFRYRVLSVPRVFMDDRSFHAGAGAVYDVYEAALCYVFATTSSTFPWFIFYIMIAFFALIVIIIFTVKRWSNTPFIDNVQSIFMWNHHASTEQVDMLLYLRAYGIDGEEEDGEGDGEPREDGEENDENADEDGEPRSRRRSSRRRSRNGRSRRSRGARQSQGGAEEADENSLGLDTLPREDDEDDGDEDNETTHLTTPATQNNARRNERRARTVAFEDYQVDVEATAAPTAASNRAGSPVDSQYVHDDLYQDMPDYYHSSSDEENAV